MLQTIPGFRGSHRILVALSLALLTALVIGIGGDAAAKGGGLVGFDRRYYVPGEVAHGRLGVSGEVAEHPAMYRLSVYLIPWRQWANEGRLFSMRTFPVSGDRVRIHGDTAVVRFVVREVPWGRYRVALCQRGGPCGRAKIDDFRNGSLHVVSDRESVPTWRTLADVSREAEVLQATVKQHGDLFRLRGERLDALETRIQELEERLEGETTTDPRPREPAGWVVATWTVLLALAVFGLVGRGAVTRAPALRHRLPARG
jgi:hypothetical protein